MVIKYAPRAQTGFNHFTATANELEWWNQNQNHWALWCCLLKKDSIQNSDRLALQMVKYARAVTSTLHNHIVGNMINILKIFQREYLWKSQIITTTHRNFTWILKCGLGRASKVQACFKFPTKKPLFSNYLTTNLSTYIHIS